MPPLNRTGTQELTSWCYNFYFLLTVAILVFIDYNQLSSMTDWTRYGMQQYVCKITYSFITTHSSLLDAQFPPLYNQHRLEQIPLNSGKKELRLACMKWWNYHITSQKSPTARKLRCKDPDKFQFCHINKSGSWFRRDILASETPVIKTDENTWMSYAKFKDGNRKQTLPQVVHFSYVWFANWKTSWKEKGEWNPSKMAIFFKPVANYHYLNLVN